MGLEEAEVMTDQGTLYISDYVNGGCVAFELTVPITGRRPPGGYGPTVMQSVSADGSVFVGYAEGDPVTGCMYAPVRVCGWCGERRFHCLKRVFAMREWWAGVMVRGMSADGSVAYGSSWENYDYGMVWWDRDGNVDWVGSDLRKVTTVQREDALRESGGLQSRRRDDMLGEPDADKPRRYVDSRYLPHGRVQCGEQYGDAGQLSGLFNTETRTTTVFDEYVGYVAPHVTDEGLGMIGLQGLGVTSGSVVGREEQDFARFDVRMDTGALRHLRFRRCPHLCDSRCEVGVRLYP